MSDIQISRTGVSLKAVQHGLERQNTGCLQTLWIELPGYCNFKCDYCYAKGGECLCKSRLLTRKQYIRILDQAKAMGVDSIGIPGAGEPFFKPNYELTMWFLNECAKRGFYITLFTTGHFMTPELAKKLYALPVEVMFKGNSLIPEVQDRFVSPKVGKQIKGYGIRRNRAIQMMIEAGFTNEEKCMAEYGRKTRLALVTSIMTSDSDRPSNYDEMADILRFCRKYNITFDCDSILKRGRGAGCDLCIAGQEIKAKLLELQQVDRTEFPGYPQWELSQSYVGTVCDRYHHHLYISQYGEIRPCIGATGVYLGSIKRITLDQAWNSPAMTIIRNRQIGGVCGTNCANFKEKKCNCCPGRWGKNYTKKFLLENGYIDTVGCWNNRPLK